MDCFEQALKRAGVDVSIHIPLGIVHDTELVELCKRMGLVYHYASDSTPPGGEVIVFPSAGPQIAIYADLSAGTGHAEYVPDLESIDRSASLIGLIEVPS